MITPVTMHDAICDFLEEEIATRFTLKAVDARGNESFRNPQIVRSGWIMPKSVDAEENPDEEFPYILPRISKVESRASRVSVVTLDILYGVYDPGVYDENGKLVDDGSGYRDLWNLIEATRQAFFVNLTLADTHKNDSSAVHLKKKYRIQDDYFDAQMLNEQIYPYWEGICTTKWDVLFPLPQLDPKFF